MIWQLPEDPKSKEQVRLALEIASGLFDAGYPTYLVGGAVRDSLLGIPNYDIDLCTSADAQTIREYLPEAKLHGPERYCVFRFSNEVGEFEIAHFRTEIECDGRHCDVELVDNLDEDLVRRDFTVNALAVSPEKLEVIDNFRGLADLYSRKLRAIGDPHRRFAEDRLRILRCIRFAAKLEFKIEKETQLAIKHEAKSVNSLSNDRLRTEVSSMLTHRNPGRAISLLAKTGIWPHIFSTLSDYPTSICWPGRLAALDRLQFRGVKENILWAILLIPELPASGDDIDNLAEELSRRGFSSQDAREILNLCRLTNYAYRYNELGIDEKIELADSGMLDKITLILKSLAPSSDFETLLHREFPKLGQKKLLTGDLLKHALEGYTGEKISFALTELRHAELSGKVTSEPDALILLEKALLRNEESTG